MAQNPLWRRTLARIFVPIFRWLYRRFTPAGWFVLGALVISAGLGADTNQSMAYQVFAFLAALIAVSFLTGIGKSPRFEARRVLPETAVAGQRVIYRLLLRNLGQRQCSAVTVSEDRPSGGMLTRSMSAEQIGPQSTSEIRDEITLSRRGKFTFSGLTVLTPHPMGLTRRPQRLAAHNSLLVLPKRYPVPTLNMPGNRKYQPGGVALSSSIGESLEFDSLRDYRPGDPVKRIHWRSWARTGRLVVKEYQDEYFVRHALILDTFTGDGDEAIFEEAVSVAASFACSVLTQESLLDLLFVGAETYRFTAGRGVGGPEKMLEVLACVAPCSNKSFKDLHHSVTAGSQAFSGCICVLLAWDEARQEFIRHLESLRVPVLVCVIADPAHGTPKPSARNVHFLELGKIAEGLARV